jgi:hypothetical protein
MGFIWVSPQAVDLRQPEDGLSKYSIFNATNLGHLAGCAFEEASEFTTRKRRQKERINIIRNRTGDILFVETRLTNS